MDEKPVLLYAMHRKEDRTAVIVAGPDQAAQDGQEECAGPVPDLRLQRPDLSGKIKTPLMRKSAGQRIRKRGQIAKTIRMVIIPYGNDESKGVTNA